MGGDFLSAMRTTPKQGRMMGDVWEVGHWNLKTENPRPGQSPISITPGTRAPARQMKERQNNGAWERGEGTFLRTLVHDFLILSMAF